MNDSQNEREERSPFQGFIPFLWIALLFAAGIIFADLVHPPAWFWLSGIGLCLLLALVMILLPKTWRLKHGLIQATRSNRRLPGIVLVGLFFFGGWRLSGSQPMINAEHAAFYNDRGTVQMLAMVIKPPDPRDSHINLIVEVESLTPLFDDVHPGEALPVSGKVLVQVPSWQNVVYGDLLEIRGELQTPFEAADFSYRDYLAHHGIYSTMAYVQVDLVEGGQGSPVKAVIYRLGNKGYEVLQKVFPSPESDLLAGILLGRDQGLSEELQEAFRRTGTTHIIAISGFNMTILAALFSGTFTRLFGRKWGALVAIGGISAYTILVGGEPAVVRAAIMGGLGVLGGMFGRRQNGLNSLGLATFGISLATPNVLWDVGFQLSLAATLGLVLYAQPLEEKLVQFTSRKMEVEKAQKLIGPLGEFFLFSLIAQIMTAPIIAYHFGTLSWLALLANPLILPPQSLVMILGGSTLLAGMILPGLGSALSVVALPFVTYTIRMVTWLGKLPGRLILQPFNFLWVILFYALFLIVTLLPKTQRKGLLKVVFSYHTAMIILLGLTCFVWRRVLALNDGRLHVTLVDAEGTLLIQTPGKKAVLIGGGASPAHLNQALDEMLPPGGNPLEFLIVGSITREDLNGLTTTLPVQNVLWCCNPNLSQLGAAIYSGYVEEEAPIIPLEPGQVLDLGDGIRLVVAWVGEKGAAFNLAWEDFSMLIPTGQAEDHWFHVQEIPDVILLPDGIKAEQIPLKQLTAWSPSVILFPLELGDIPLEGEHGGLALLKDYPVISTVDYGWVRVSTDGGQAWVTGEQANN